MNIMKYFSIIVAKRATGFIFHCEFENEIFLFEFLFGLKNIFGAVFCNKSFDKYYCFKYYYINNKIMQSLTKKQIIRVSIVKTRSVVFVVINNSIIKNVFNICSYYYDIIDLIIQYIVYIKFMCKI